MAGYPKYAEINEYTPMAARRPRPAGLGGLDDVLEFTRAFNSDLSSALLSSGGTPPYPSALSTYRAANPPAYAHQTNPPAYQNNYSSAQNNYSSSQTNYPSSILPSSQTSSIPLSYPPSYPSGLPTARTAPLSSNLPTSLPSNLPSTLPLSRPTTTAAAPVESTMVGSLGSSRAPSFATEYDRIASIWSKAPQSSSALESRNWRQELASPLCDATDRGDDAPSSFDPRQTYSVSEERQDVMLGGANRLTTSVNRPANQLYTGEPVSSPTSAWAPSERRPSNAPVDGWLPNPLAQSAPVQAPAPVPAPAPAPIQAPIQAPVQAPAPFYPHSYGYYSPASMYDAYHAAAGFNPALAPYGVPFNPYMQNGHAPQGRRDGPNSLTRSRILEDFRANVKSRRYELKDVYNHFVEFSGDQHGSRFIQSKLETANSDEKDQIFKEIEPNAVQLMKDVFGNYVIQKFFEHGNQMQKKALAAHMKGRMANLSTEMYACRVVQKALDHILVDQQAELVQELKGDIGRIIKDNNGNHVIQKILELVPRQYTGFIMDAIRPQIIGLAQHSYGCRVIQRILEHGTDADKEVLLNELHAYTYVLTTDPFGNYVIQHIVQHGKPEDRTRVIEVVIANIVTLAKHKLASNVVEKCIVFGRPEERSAIRLKLSTPMPDGSSPLMGMMKDQYANYVVQKLLGTLEGEEQRAFVEVMRPHFDAIKKVTNGRQIAALDRLLAAAMAATSLHVDVSSPSATPVLTMEPNTPQSSSPPSTKSGAGDYADDGEDAARGSKTTAVKGAVGALLGGPRVRVDES